MEFQGKIITLTGAAGGIGAALAREFAARGARLMLCDLDEPALSDLAGELGALVRPVVTPRFVPTCSQELMEGLGDIATRHELTFRDVLGLLSAPTVHDHLTVHRLAVLVAQLEEAAQNGVHQMCEMMLCVLIKSDLVHMCDATTACDLRCLVTRLEREWRDAGTVGAAPLARLGRVLLVKLDNVGEPPHSPKDKQF